MVNHGMATQNTAWKQSEVFPLISYVITAEFQQVQRFITSPEIANALLRDPEARRIIDAVVQQRGGTVGRTAINMGCLVQPAYYRWAVGVADQIRAHTHRRPPYLQTNSNTNHLTNRWTKARRRTIQLSMNSTRRFDGRAHARSRQIFLISLRL